MLKRIAGLGLILILLLSTPVFAQDSGEAHVRVMALFYSDMDVYLDGEPAVQNLGFSFDTDYLPLSAGTHTLVVSNVDAGIEAGVTLDMELVEGHNYIVVAYGNWDTEENATLTLIDETEQFAGMDEATNRILFMHLVSMPIEVDGYINDELVGGGLSYGQVMAFAVKPGPFTTKITTAGAPDAVLFTNDFIGEPQAVTFAAIVATNLANAFLVFSTTTDMNMADYLAFAKANDAVGIDLAVEALESTALFEELKGEGPFTLFIPIDEGMQAIPETVKLDIEKVLRGHVVPGYWPSYLLDGQTSLTNLNGDELTITYPDNDWWKLNGQFSIYNHTRVSNGVVYPVEGLIVPGE